MVRANRVVELLAGVLIVLVSGCAPDDSVTFDKNDPQSGGSAGADAGTSPGTGGSLSLGGSTAGGSDAGGVGGKPDLPIDAGSSGGDAGKGSGGAPGCVADLEPCTYDTECCSSKCVDDYWAEDGTIRHCELSTACKPYGASCEKDLECCSHACWVDEWAEGASGGGTCY
jgi:hypothetical protein